MFVKSPINYSFTSILQNGVIINFSFLSYQTCMYVYCVWIGLYVWVCVCVQAFCILFCRNFSAFLLKI